MAAKTSTTTTAAAAAQGGKESGKRVQGVLGWVAEVRDRRHKYISISKL